MCCDNSKQSNQVKEEKTTYNLDVDQPLCGFLNNELHEYNE